MKQQKEQTWIQKQDLDNQPKQMRYLWSIYYAIITMVTVGYGDITPISWQERIYVIVITIFSCGMFGYSMNTIGTIFSEIAKREATFKQVKYDMGQYMRSRDISKYLQTKVLKNLEYSNILDGNLVQKSEVIMNKLTITLRNQIKREFYGRILSTYKLFNLNFSQEIRSDLCLHMKEIILQPGEILYDQGQQNDRIYFLHKGSVELIYQSQNKQNQFTIGLANSGSMLGQYGFFTNQTEILQARCFDTCFLIYCDRVSFLQVLSKFKYDQVIIIIIIISISTLLNLFQFYQFCCLKKSFSLNLLIFNYQPKQNRKYFVSCETICQTITDNMIQHVLAAIKPDMKQANASCMTARYCNRFAQPDTSRAFLNREIQIQPERKYEVMINARRLRLLYFYHSYDCDFMEINDEDLELDTHDMDFLLFIPKIYYRDGCIEFSEGEISNFSDSQYERYKKENSLPMQNSDKIDAVRKKNKAREENSKQNSQDKFPQLNTINSTENKQSESDISSSLSSFDSKSDTKTQKMNTLSIKKSQIFKSYQQLPANQKDNLITKLQVNKSSLNQVLDLKQTSSKQCIDSEKQSESSQAYIESKYVSGEIVCLTEDLIPSPQHNETKLNLKDQESFFFANYQPNITDPILKRNSKFHEKNSSDITPIILQRNISNDIQVNNTTSVNNQIPLTQAHYPDKRNSIFLNNGFNNQNIKRNSKQINDHVNVKNDNVNVKNGFTPRRPSILTNIHSFSHHQRGSLQFTNLPFNQLQSNQSLKSIKNLETVIKNTDMGIKNASINKQDMQTSKQQGYTSQNNYNNNDTVEQKLKTFFPCQNNLENFECINNFDRFKEFQGYYPHNNIMRVLLQYRDKFLNQINKKSKQNRLALRYGNYKKLSRTYITNQQF